MTLKNSDGEIAKIFDILNSNLRKVRSYLFQNGQGLVVKMNDKIILVRWGLNML